MLFIYFWERETENEWERGRERERGQDTQNQKQDPGIWDDAWDPGNHEIMTWAEVGCLTDWATQVPPQDLF